MFERWIEINRKKSGLILGPRRSGKTTLLKMRFPEYNYATLDNLDYLSWANRDAKGLVESLGPKAIIDEIQRQPQITIAVKYAIDNQDAHILMTGSSSVGLLGSMTDTLAGRIQIYSLPTACWGENLGPPTHKLFEPNANPVEIKQGQRVFSSALNYGLFPEIVLQKKSKNQKDLLLNYRDTYFTRDLMQLSNMENMEGLLALFFHLARSIGSHLEVSNFARESGLSYPTTKKYLNNMFYSQLTFSLYGYHFGPAKRFIKAAKTYFSDNGILTSLNIPVSEGQLFENFVISEFEKRRKLGFIKCDRLYYYKSVGGREIDLVYEIGKNIFAIEVKNTRQPSTKDIRNLLEFSSSMKKAVKMYLVYPGDEYFTLNQVKIIPVAGLFRGQ
ncbi:ATP-binding protein [candidate division KSB1 bacterium]|nr:ATP-binding protein [candidate division KSB1 bacterium]